MDSAKLNDWMQVVGIFALVASLVFIGLQMKQSQEIALAAQYHARAETTQVMWMAMLESDRSFELIQDKTYAELTPAEQSTMINATHWAWIQYDNHYYQYNAGFLDNEAWDGLSRRIQDLYGLCEGRVIWENERQYLRQSFVNYVESFDDACQPPSQGGN